jgi:hypothetical protein
MKRLMRWSFLGMVVLLVGGLTLAACGGDDDDDDGGGDSGGVSAPGSSGGSDSKDTGNVSAPSGSDEKYVGQLCKATLELSGVLTKFLADAGKDPSKFEDPEAVKKAFLGPMEDYLKAMEKADPPGDMKSYHNDAIKAIKQFVEELKKGEDLESIGDKVGEFPEPPAGVQARLAKAAANNKDCKEAGVSFEP